MKPEFTENEFGTAFTMQFIEKNQPSLDGYPEIPNLKEEGEFGYDVAFHLLMNELHYSIFSSIKHQTISLYEKGKIRNFSIYS